MNTLYEDEEIPINCSDTIVLFIRRTLNLNVRYSHFYERMNRIVMQQIRDKVFRTQEKNV